VHQCCRSEAVARRGRRGSIEDKRGINGVAWYGVNRCRPERPSACCSLLRMVIARDCESRSARTSLDGMHSVELAHVTSADGDGQARRTWECHKRRNETHNCGTPRMLAQNLELYSDTSRQLKATYYCPSCHACQRSV